MTLQLIVHRCSTALTIPQEPFTPEHESGTTTSSSLSKATTASIINILSE
jgi:hypothetical protein